MVEKGNSNMKKTILTIIILFFVCSTALAADVTLIWNEIPEAYGYKLYYGTAPRLYNKVVNVGYVHKYTFTNIDENKSCYFSITYYDSKGLESRFLEEISGWVVKPSYSKH